MFWDSAVAPLITGMAPVGALRRLSYLAMNRSAMGGVIFQLLSYFRCCRHPGRSTCLIISCLHSRDASTVFTTYYICRGQSSGRYPCGDCKSRYTSPATTWDGDDPVTSTCSYPTPPCATDPGRPVCRNEGASER